MREPVGLLMWDQRVNSYWVICMVHYESNVRHIKEQDPAGLVIRYWTVYKDCFPESTGQTCFLCPNYLVTGLNLLSGGHWFGAPGPENFLGGVNADM